MKLKIGIVLSCDEYVRNYIATKAFESLASGYELKFFISDKVKNLAKFPFFGNFIVYKNDSLLNISNYNFFDFLCWHYRKKSISFQYRIDRIEKGNVFIFPRSLIDFFKFPIRYFRFLYKNLIRYLMRMDFIFPYVYNYYKNKCIINKDLENKIISSSLDLILFISSAYDPDGNSVVQISKKNNIKSAFLIDNWDNLSSKTVLWVRPDFVGVWGLQSANHAVSIQDFKRDQVYLLGTPRFDSYFQLRDTNLISHFPFQYILFVGQSLIFDEVACLTKLNEIIESSPEFYFGLKIVYRPHPYRGVKIDIDNLNLKHIIIDPQIRDMYHKSNIESEKFHFDLNYLPSLIKNAEFVLGGLTTMLIESLIFRKMYLALVYDDFVNFTSPNIMLDRYTHFVELKYLKSINFCANFIDLKNVFLEVWSNRILVNIVVDSEVEFFLHNDSEGYIVRLRKFVDSIVNSENVVL